MAFLSYLRRSRSVMMLRTPVAAPLLILAGLALSSCSSDAAPSASEGVPPASEGATLEPAMGVYFGVNLDFEHDSAAGFNERLGKKAAVYVQFVEFPLDDAAIVALDAFVEQVKSQNGMGMITLEPHAGLEHITADVALDFADRMAAYNERGVPLFVRFAHEMNGSWYPWSQDPTRYVDAFRVLASAIHERADETATIWAPNYGGGYPFSGGAYERSRRRRRSRRSTRTAMGGLRCPTIRTPRTIRETMLSIG